MSRRSGYGVSKLAFLPRPNKSLIHREKFNNELIQFIETEEFMNQKNFVLMRSIACNRLFVMLTWLVIFYNITSYWEIINWVELLIKISQSQALAVLRKTRPKGVRTWEEEAGEIVATAGMAYLKLNRPKQAAKLFSIVWENILARMLGIIALSNSKR